MTNDKPQTCDSHRQSMIDADTALARLLNAARPVTETEQVSILEALGRTAAEDIVSTIDVPGHDNSAMDGYAVRSVDVKAPGTKLQVTQRIAAGSTGAPVEAGCAARIFTGAPIPAGADAVVMQENCALDGDVVTINQTVSPGLNIRPQGNDMASGQTAIEAGTRIGPAQMSLAAGVGVAQIPVFRRLRAAILYTGDEIIEPGRPLEAGQIYNSNRYALRGLLQALGVEVVVDQHVEDTLDATRAAFAQASTQADVIISSGGVSVGGEDHVKPAIEAEGQLDMWKIAMKPGKPLAFGAIGDATVFGLPGNPVSVFVTFLLFVRPYLLKMQGGKDYAARPIPVRAGFDWSKPGIRREFARARVKINDNHELEAQLFPRMGSDVSSSVAWADGLVVIPEHQTIARGETVDFLGFDGLMAGF
jgi:molybdopterin molybdotransferase